MEFLSYLHVAIATTTLLWAQYNGNLSSPIRHGYSFKQATVVISVCLCPSLLPDWPDSSHVSILWRSPSCVYICLLACLLTVNFKWTHLKYFMKIECAWRTVLQSKRAKLLTFAVVLDTHIKCVDKIHKRMAQHLLCFRLISCHMPANDGYLQKQVPKRLQKRS